MAFVTDGTTQVHLAERDLDVGFRTGKPLNPLERGHIAFRTDDIDAFKRRLDEKGIPYADYGDLAMSGGEEIFFQIRKATSSCPSGPVLTPILPAAAIDPAAQPRSDTEAT